MNTQQPGPIVANDYPEQRAGGYVTLNAPAAGLAHIVRVNTHDLPTARLFAASYTAFDRAGRALHCDAAELAASLDVAELIRAVKLAIDAHGAQQPGDIETPLDRALYALGSAIMPALMLRPTLSTLPRESAP